MTACDHPVYDTSELLGCERPDGNVRPGSQNDDGSRKDGFLHEPMSRFKAAKKLVKNEGILTEAEVEVKYAEADAKQRRDAAEKAREKKNVEARVSGETDELHAPEHVPASEGMMALVKRRVRELDAMGLEPDDGRLAVREKYTILASVAMDEVKEEMKNPKAQRTC